MLLRPGQAWHHQQSPLAAAIAIPGARLAPSDPGARAIELAWVGLGCVGVVLSDWLPGWLYRFCSLLTTGLLWASNGYAAGSHTRLCPSRPLGKPGCDQETAHSRRPCCFFFLPFLAFHFFFLLFFPHFFFFTFFSLFSSSLFSSFLLFLHIFFPHSLFLHSSFSVMPIVEASYSPPPTRLTHILLIVVG